MFCVWWLLLLMLSWLWDVQALLNSWLVVSLHLIYCICWSFISFIWSELFVWAWCSRYFYCNRKSSSKSFAFDGLVHKVGKSISNIILLVLVCLLSQRPVEFGVEMLVSKSFGSNESSVKNFFKKKVLPYFFQLSHFTDSLLGHLLGQEQTMRLF